MNTRAMLLWTALLSVAVSGEARAGAGRTVESFNAGWRFLRGEHADAALREFDDASWDAVTLPHTWNREDPWEDVEPAEELFVTLSYYRGPGWYRKRFFVPASDRSRRLWLEFEAAAMVAEVWVNGHSVGRHVGGYSAFTVDITGAVRFGEDNAVAVRVSNAYNGAIPPLRADYTMYGGLYRDVWLITTAPVWCERVLVSTPSVTALAAETAVEAIVRSSLAQPFRGSVDIRIVDPAGEPVLRRAAPVELPVDGLHRVRISLPELAHPVLWSDRQPRLYRCTVDILDESGEMLDTISSRFGYRWFRFDPDSGFFLNGIRTPLRGVNRHQDRQGYGAAVPDELHVADMALIQSMGANFVRLAHYPQDPSVLRACDSLGLLVWEEIPVVTSVGRGEFAANAKTMLREMITQHFNHPSIVIWGLMNETARTQPPDDLHLMVDLCRELQTLARELDPWRRTAQAQYGDRGTELLEITDIRGWNRYFGWYFGTFDEFGPFMDAEKRRDPDQVIIISEYGAGHLRGYHTEHPMPSDFTEEWALAFHRSYWHQIQERPYIAGSAVWNMFDFASDEKTGNDPRINQKGLMTFDRKPKDAFYFYQSRWSETPMVYILSHTWLERTGVAGVPAELEVFSNCDEVEVWVNGESCGVRRDPFRWRVDYTHGYNEIRAVGRRGASTVEDFLSIKYTELGGGDTRRADDTEQ